MIGLRSRKLNYVSVEKFDAGTPIGGSCAPGVRSVYQGRGSNGSLGHPLRRLLHQRCSVEKSLAGHTMSRRALHYIGEVQFGLIVL